MSVGYVHNRVLLDPIAKKALHLGFKVDREVPIKVGRHVLFGDLIIQADVRQILVEVEMSSRRITNDLAKAQALGECELWIVVPNPKVARSVRRRLVQQSIEPGRFGLFILLLPQAFQRLEAFLELNSGSNASEKK